ncbi:Mitogen-activated protein kinase kinase kinase 1, partial [Ananas comosus]
VVNPRRTYGPAADIWSLGCTVLEMLTRQLPYPNLEWTQALFKIGRGEQPPIPNFLSTDARDFISQCVKVNPDDRPSTSQLLEHPFVKRSIDVLVVLARFGEHLDVYGTNLARKGPQILISAKAADSALGTGTRYWVPKEKKFSLQNDNSIFHEKGYPHLERIDLAHSLLLRWYKHPYPHMEGIVVEYSGVSGD